MKLSVIVTTFNKPRDLERVLWGYAVQTAPGAQVVVADDGSGPETAEVVARMRERTGLALLHVWHPDQGFRKSEIVNRAIAASSGDYLLFTDGDTIPRADLVEVHRRLARPGRFLAGGYLKLPAQTSDAITVDDVRAGRMARLGWLRAHGWRPGHRALRLVGGRRVGALFDLLTPTRPLFAGNNTSVWRTDVYAVNGFDMEMGYGGQDRSVGYRLETAGVRGMQVRHRAVAVHLHHERPYRDAAGVAQNRAVMDAMRRAGETRARRGLAELEPDPSVRIDGAPSAQETR